LQNPNPSLEGIRHKALMKHTNINCRQLTVEEPVGEPVLLEADGKYPDTRHPKSRGMRRTYWYAAVTRDEDNAVDGGFPTASRASCNKE
jgi:hypothetical protein